MGRDSLRDRQNRHGSHLFVVLLSAILLGAELSNMRRFLLQEICPENLELSKLVAPLRSILCAQVL